MTNQTISHYTILEKLGEGGMGVVYKARDTKLDRHVALKFLPERLSVNDVELKRFIQEAKAAAALNHPNICTIYGIEEVEGKNFIVMELVEGHTLQEKKAGLSVKQALNIGIQIAEGLAAAHDKGIVHRDVKPENIMIHKDGRVQIMDFGLANLRGVSRLTKEGSTVGTAGYMSPEQVQGEETDHRSDIFSLGVVLYELLTGQLPFKGMHETAIAYEIVNVEFPPMSSVRSEISPELDAVVMACLEKDPNERTQSAKQVAVELRRCQRKTTRMRLTRVMPAVSSLEKQAQGAPSKMVQYLPWLVTAVVSIGALVGAFVLSRGTGSDDGVSRFDISVVTSPGERMEVIDRPVMALSPDGRMLAYTMVEGGALQLYIRSLENFDERLIQGTKTATAPFFSPDGQWVGFIADQKIKKVRVSGGTVETICDAPSFRGAAWGPDDRIYYSPTFESGIMSISAAGGEPKVVSTLDTARLDRTHRWPQALPGGEWILYTVGDKNNAQYYTEAFLVMQSIKTGETHTLDVRGEMARYVEPGYLVVARSGTLFAAPFSLSDFRTTKPLVPVISDVNGDPGSGITNFTVSDNGHLLYIAGKRDNARELVWVTRDGSVTPLSLGPQSLGIPRLSPDGSKIAVTVGAGTALGDIWVYDLKKGSFNRLTFSVPNMDNGASAIVWNPDGTTIYYTGIIGNDAGVWVQPSDGSTTGTLLYADRTPGSVASLRPGGDEMILNLFTGGPSGTDIQVMKMNKVPTPAPLLATPAYEFGGYFSPDGKYITYVSNETTVMEVYVRSFPDLKGKWQISVGGGSAPLFSPDGKELYYVNTSAKLMAVPIKLSPSFSMEEPRELFDVSGIFFASVASTSDPERYYDITPDGKRFLMLRTVGGNSGIRSFNYVQNWIQELEDKFQ